MGTLATHFTTFLILTPIGLRRLLCSTSLYLQNPSHFHSKPWFFSKPTWKNIDIFALLVSLPIASLSLFFTFLSSQAGPTFRFEFLEQSIVVLMFWVVLILVFCGESYDLWVISEGLVFGFGGVCFFVEYWMSGNGFGGLSGDVYGLLGGLSLMCGVCCWYLSVKPTAFFAEFFLCGGIVFKGTWVLQAGLSLYTDEFGLRGCRRISVPVGVEMADVKCDLEEDSLRAVALINLLFIGHAVVVVVTVVGIFLLLASNRNLRCGEAGGPLLAGLELDNALRRPVVELEMD